MNSIKYNRKFFTDKAVLTIIIYCSIHLNIMFYILLILRIKLIKKILMQTKLNY